MSNPQDAYGPSGQPLGPPPGGWQPPGPPGPPPDPPGPPPQQPGWGGQGQWGGPPGPVGSPPKSKLPLILAVSAVVVVVAGVIGFLALRGDDDDTTVTVAPDDLTEEDLEGLLLQADDIGDGFTEAYRGEKQDSDSDLAGMPAECEEGMEAMAAPDADDRIELAVKFERDDEASVEQRVSPVREDPRPVSELLEIMNESCSGTMSVTNDEGDAFEMQFEAEAVSGLGEEAFAVTMSLDHELFRGSVDVYMLGFAQDGISSSVTVTPGFDIEASTTTEVVPHPRDDDLAHELAELVEGRIQDMD